jgi:hypothetical protein
VQLAKPKSEAAGSTSAAGDSKHAKVKDQEAMSPHSASASEPVSATDNAPGAAALLTTADARGGTAAPDEPATTQDPTVGVGGAQPSTTDPATAAAPTADTAPAPVASSTPPDDDAGSAPANGSGGLSAPPAP